MSQDKTAAMLAFEHYWMEKYGRPGLRFDWGYGIPSYTPPESEWHPLANSFDESLEDEWAAFQAGQAALASSSPASAAAPEQIKDLILKPHADGVADLIEDAAEYGRISDPETTHAMTVDEVAYVQMHVVPWIRSLSLPPHSPSPTSADLEAVARRAAGYALGHPTVENGRCPIEAAVSHALKQGGGE